MRLTTNNRRYASAPHSGRRRAAKRKVLARIIVVPIWGAMKVGRKEGRKEGGASPQADRTDISATRNHADLLFISSPYRPLSNAHAHNTHLCYTDATTNQRIPSQRQRPNRPCSPRLLPRCSIPRSTWVQGAPRRKAAGGSCTH
jgi:hypothetical protein